MRIGTVMGLVAFSFLIVMTMGSNTPVFGQVVDFSGEWLDNSFEEDDRGGPATAASRASSRVLSDGMIGNYLGIPYNDAGRQKGASYSLSMFSHPAVKFRPHTMQYSMRGVIGNWRMSKVVDPVTKVLVAYRIEGGYNLDRTIWMDGRGHPPDYAEHSYVGFSTGRYERGMLVVTTTHMKFGTHKRNGAPASSEATLTEYFIRHGDRLTHVQLTDDPSYLEEPYIRTTDHILAVGRHARGNQRNLWNTSEEVAWEDEYLPHFPLGTRHTDLADMLGIPFETTQGGSETLYPEYRTKLREMVNERVR